MCIANTISVCIQRFRYIVPFEHVFNEKVKGKQWLGTDANRTEVLPSKPKWKTTKATNGHNKENIWLT